MMGYGWGYFAWWMWAFMLVGTVAFWVFVGYVVRAVLLDRRPRETGRPRGPGSRLHQTFMDPLPNAEGARGQ